MFEWLADPYYWSLILPGFALTIEITLFGVALGLILGTLLAIGDIYGGKVLKGAIAVYVEFFRGSPLFIQIFIAVYTVPALLNIPIDHFLGLFGFWTKQRCLPERLCEGIYANNPRRPDGCGLIRRHVQMADSSLRNFCHKLTAFIPSWTNEFCSLTKSSAVLGFIGFYDLTSAGTAISCYTMEILGTWIVIGIIYLAWITAFAKVMDIIYEKKRIPGIQLEMQS